MDLYKIATFVLLCIAVLPTPSSSHECLMCPHDHHRPFCMRVKHCGTSTVDPLSSGLLSRDNLWVEFAKLLNGQECDMIHHCKRFDDLRNVQLVEYDDDIYKYFQFGEYCAIVKASMVACNHYCCDKSPKCTSEGYTSYRWHIPEDAIVSKQCTICYRTNSHTDSYCEQYKQCDGIVSPGNSRMLSNYNMAQLVHHDNCNEQHKGCHTHTNIRNVHLVERHGKVYKYFQRDNQCVLMWTEEFRCRDNCCPSVNALVQHRTDGLPEYIHKTTSVPKMTNIWTRAPPRTLATLSPNNDCNRYALLSALLAGPYSQTGLFPCIQTNKGNGTTIVTPTKTTPKTKTAITKSTQETTVRTSTSATTTASPTRSTSQTTSTTTTVSPTTSTSQTTSATTIASPTTSTSQTTSATTIASPTTSTRQATSPITNTKLVALNKDKTCDKLNTITALAHSEIVTTNADLVCSDGSHSLSEAAVMKLCNVTQSQQWKKGAQVIPNCSNINQYTAIASITDSGYFKDGVSGVLMSCNLTHIKLATQDCNEGLKLLHLSIFDKNAYTTNALNYYVIN